MKTLKQFITESQLTGSRGYLYHATDVVSLLSILKFGKIGIPGGKTSYDDYDPAKGVEGVHKGFVSFTRDKNYRVRGKENVPVMLVFDKDRLMQKGYKIKPVVDPNLEIDRKVGQRSEAEERIMGPIKLEDGLREIIVDKKTHDYIKTTAEKFKSSVEQAKLDGNKLRQKAYEGFYKEMAFALSKVKVKEKL